MRLLTKEELREQLVTCKHKLEQAEYEIEQLKSKADTKAITMLFAYAGLITSLDEPITFSSSHWATPAADIAGGIMEANNLIGECDFSDYTPFDYKQSKPVFCWQDANNELDIDKSLEK